MAARKTGSARAVALPASRRRFDARRLLPTRRSLVVASALVVCAAAAYAAAAETSVFAVTDLEIAGGSPRVQAEVRRALAPELGRSQLRVSDGEIDRRAAAVPDVVSLTFDRRFPHTLRVKVEPERGLLLLRRGDKAWLVSSRARVMRRLRDPRRSSLPRLWVPRGTAVSVGATLGAAAGALAAAALVPVAAGAFPRSVRAVREGPDELTLVMQSSVEVRLGTIGDLRLKLAIAKRILALAGADAGSGTYVDVSVPERPVLGSANGRSSGSTNSQVATGA